MEKIFAVDNKGRVVATQSLLPRMIAGAAKLAAGQGLRLVKALGRPAQEVEALAAKNAQFLRRLEAADAKREAFREEMKREAFREEMKREAFREEMKRERAAKIAARLKAKAERAARRELRRSPSGAASNDLP